ncbi:MAG: 30S ribosomal protein S16 [Candidatus Stahlbacteria bacterium]|nr:30S ribosomal protein S16 [Candidatus Stahlbacteria bacterium]
MVKIRLFRMGKRGAPFYRIVVADVRVPRNGKYIEKLGWYDPRGKELQLDLGKAKEWMKKGAQPTSTVTKLMKRKEEE